MNANETKGHTPYQSEAATDVRLARIQAERDTLIRRMDAAIVGEQAARAKHDRMRAERGELFGACRAVANCAGDGNVAFISAREMCRAAIARCEGGKAGGK